MMNYIWVSLGTLIVMTSMFYACWYTVNVEEENEEQFEKNGYNFY